MKRTVYVLSIGIIIFGLPGCDDQKKKHGPGNKDDTGAESEVVPGTMPEKCGKSVPVTLSGNGRYVIAVSVEPGSCPLKVTPDEAGGVVDPGMTRTRIVQGPQDLTFECTSEGEKTCKASYVTAETGTGALQFGSQQVSGKCNETKSVIDLAQGKYTLLVKVDKASNCPVEVTDVEASPVTIEVDKSQEWKRFDGGKTVTISCGFAQENKCSYSFTLSRAGK